MLCRPYTWQADIDPTYQVGLVEPWVAVQFRLEVTDFGTRRRAAVVVELMASVQAEQAKLRREHGYG